MNQVTPLIKDFLQRVQQEVIPKIVNATLPFYAVQNDQIVRDRSGVFLRIAGDHFILTASHDLKAIVDNNIHLYVGWSEEESAPVPIHDSVFHTSEEDSRDIALIKLTADTAKQVASSSQPISLPTIAQNCEFDNAFYMVSGYPKEWLSVFPDQIESAPLNYLCRPYSGEELPTETFKYDPSVHFQLELQRKAVAVHSLNEVMLPAKEGIKGISGCGVWRIAGYSTEAISSWKPDDVQLVGIEHRYWQKQGAVAATRIEHMLSFLAAGFPQVVPAMRLVYP